MDEMPDMLKWLARSPGYFVERITDEQRAEHNLGPGWTVRFNLLEWRELHGIPSFVQLEGWD